MDKSEEKKDHETSSSGTHEREELEEEEEDKEPDVYDHYRAWVAAEDPSRMSIVF